jgi:hypothetical protein
MGSPFIVPRLILTPAASDLFAWVKATALPSAGISAAQISKRAIADNERAVYLADDGQMYDRAMGQNLSKDRNR